MRIESFPIVALQLINEKSFVEKEVNRLKIMANLAPQKEVIKKWLKDFSLGKSINNNEIINGFVKIIYIFDDAVLMYNNIDNEEITLKKALEDYKSLSANVECSTVVSFGRPWISKTNTRHICTYD